MFNNIDSQAVVFAGLVTFFWAFFTVACFIAKRLVENFSMNNDPTDIEGLARSIGMIDTQQL